MNLAYNGIESEAEDIKKAIQNGAYKVRLSYASEAQYSLIRLQVSFLGDLRDPLHTEALSDILNKDVQDFYCALNETGRYELSVHARLQHLHSVFGTISQQEIADMYGGFEKRVKNMKKIKPADMNMMAAVRTFESKHPMGEGL